MANLASATLGQTSNLNPIQDYTPEKQSPSFSGIINEIISRATYSTAGPVTYTTGDILGGFINRDTNGAIRTDTLPTAALLIPLIEGAKVGSAIMLYIKNTAGAANTLTVAAGTGGTVIGTATVAQNNIKAFLLIVTAIPTQSAAGTYDLVSLGTSTF